MKRTLLVLAACGQPHGSGANPDSGTGDAALAGSDGSGSPDATSGWGEPQPIPLTACGGTVEQDIALPTALDFDSFGTFQDPPLLLAKDSARVFYVSTGDLMTSAHGSAQTAKWPAALSGATMVYGERAISGGAAVVFNVGTQPMASLFDGTSFAAPSAVPCTPGDFANSECWVRAAGDGHVWVASGQHLYEQTPNGFEDRGGAPIFPALFQVTYGGDVLVASSGGGQDLVQVWKLARGAGGWTKMGALTPADLTGITIEGGFHLDGVIGAFAPDGSIHIFSSARCIGTGERNIQQVYARSRDGGSWVVEALPAIGTFTDNQLTWRNLAAWASDYDNVRFADMSSPPPHQDTDGTWIYPDRQINAIARCLASGHPAFERVAKVRLPGWTVRGFASFSDTGQISFLTSLGLTQVYRP